MSDNPVAIAVGRLAGAQRKDRPYNAERVADARNELVAAKLERMILAAIDPPDRAYEPLRPKDRRRLASLLRG